MSDSLQDRGKAIEDVFFAEQDKKLLDKIREEMAAKESRAALETASGISDAAALDALTESGITPESLTSIALIPLVVVAWSDDKMEDSEKAAILQAADAAGITTGTASYETMKAWLAKKPGSDLLDAWKAYVSSLKSSLDDVAFAQLKTSIIGRAEGVAEAAGGFLGLGNKISASERKVLDELAAAFD
jgi:hypothetical protein